MALTNAERQRRYRQRTFGSGGSLKRLSTPLNAQASEALDRLALGYGRTKREVVEQALGTLEAAVTHRLPEPDRTAYRNGTLARGALQEALRRHEPAAKAAERAHRKRSSNPEHQRLFTIPTPLCSHETALTVPSLPEPQRVTGDREVDACLWLRRVCQTTRDERVLDSALEAAERIKTPAEAIEQRYVDWLKRQPNIHSMQIMFASIGMADIKDHVAKARERIRVYNEGVALFGSYAEAMMPTPAEQMVQRTVGVLPEGEDPWGWEQDRLAALFTRSVNPTSLTEAAAELRYWQWLYQTRWNLQKTEAPDESLPDDPPEVLARRDYVEGLLCALPPQDQQEVLHLIEEVRSGLVDTGSVDDYRDQAAIFEHLLRQLVAA